MKATDLIDQDSLRTDVPDFASGDEVEVHVERTFPLHSPIIAKLVVLKRGDVRRAKLYYLRDRKGKAARIREKREY